MAADLEVLAGFGFCIAQNLVVALPASRFFRFVSKQTDEIREKAGIALAPEEDAIGGKSVASGTACFLIILLDGFWQREVDHSANGGLVDAESESNCADEDADFVGHPAFLILATALGIHFAVIRKGWDFVLLEEFDGRFHFRNRGRIDDQIRFRVVANRGEQHLVLLLFAALHCEIPQIGTIEAGDVFVRIVQAKLLDDVVTDVLRGAGRECGDALVGEFGAQAAELPIFGAEFVAPFRDAVGFVDCKKRDRDAAKPLRRVGSGEPLGR